MLSLTFVSFVFIKYDSACSRYRFFTPSAVRRALAQLDKADPASPFLLASFLCCPSGVEADHVCLPLLGERSLFITADQDGLLSGLSTPLLLTHAAGDFVIEARGVSAKLAKTHPKKMERVERLLREQVTLIAARTGATAALKKQSQVLFLCLFICLFCVGACYISVS